MNKAQKAAYTAASGRWLFVMGLVLTSCALLSASSVSGNLVAHNTPGYVSSAKNLGAVDPSKTIEVSIWLNPHNRGELDALTQSLYDRTSPNYRHWLKTKDIAARFMPTAAEAKTVQSFFEAHNLKVVRVGANNFFVRARGTVGDVEKAFQVQLNNYEVLGNVVRANDRDPYVDGAAGRLVGAVMGLDSGKYEHPLMQRSIPSGTGKAVAAQGVHPDDIYSNVCFPGTETDVFSNNDNGSLPVATYKGNVLSLQNLTSNGCAYTPPMIQAAYNLTGLYNEGYTGSGQTIGIIDWCGSLTIQSDANAFSAQYSLPLLTSSNFAITYTPTPSSCEAADQVEINIDVEWAHAIAPGANINLIVPPTASFQDVDEAEYNAVNYGMANVLSGSYGSIESFTPATILTTENLISETAAASGISTNFSSGDVGDFSAEGIPPTVSAPADSPWATAVGGVTLALNPDNSIAWQAGWGNNETLLAEEGFVSDPPSEEAFGFIGGSGGGPSNCASQDSSGNCLAGFPKPSFQKKLPGKYRQLPDISWLADPYTGVAILISIPGDVPAQTWQVWGGTSVACPMFSGLWAIANQEAEAGGGPALGLAAQYLYSMPAGAITDVVPVGTPKTNVTGSIQDTSGKTAYNANAVLGGGAPSKFVSALWDYAWLQETGLVISFGTDCTAGPTYGVITACTASNSLHTKTGWDNVTGVGTPNAQAFADSFYGK
ncbi:MAG: S53 family peptidase [Terriglobales bacterium]